MSRCPTTFKILCSSKEIDTFDANGNEMSDDKFFDLIKTYNDHALFSSEYDRPVSQENRHIHWLIKQVERLKKQIDK